MRRSLTLTFLIAVSALLTVRCQAQRASLSGSVTDPNGTTVGAVEVVALNLDQGLKRETQTNEHGVFSIPLLQPGTYLVSAQKDGFAVSEVRDVRLHVGEDLGLKIELRIGASPIQVQVTDKPDRVETVSPTLGSVVTGDVVRDAPLNGRDVRDLALLQPGVTPTDLDDFGAGSFNVAGARSDSVAYLINGGLNNDLIDNRAVFVPNPDTVAEFRILTSNYPAEYGRNSGGIVSIATRSGSSKYHGSLFDFFRNDALDANSYFNKVNGAPRGVLKRNQFGGTFGGPIPKPGDNHEGDRLFFFLGYQGERQVQALEMNSVPVYTQAELNGNFSSAGAGGSPDPNVAEFLLANPHYQPNPVLAGQGIIDPAKIDPVAQNYIAEGLIPTSASGLLSSQERFTLNSNELTTKLDFNANSANKLAITTGWNGSAQLTPYDFANVPGYSNFSTFHDLVVNAAYTHIFSPRTINEVDATFERTTQNAENPAAALPQPQTLGIAVTPDLSTGPTNLSFSDGLQIGFSPAGPQRLAGSTYTYADAVTLVRGNHTLKFGGGFSAYQNNLFFAFYTNGLFYGFGQNPFGSQNPLADFLLGIPAAYLQGSAAPSNIRSKFTNGFGQDDWRIHKNLVLSLGLRYEYATPKLDTQGRTFSVIPGLQSQRFPDAPPGMVFPGDPGAPRGVNFPDPNNWAPRLGFAWDVTGKGRTSLRGAFGVFYDILKGEDNLQFNGAPPFYSNASLVFGAPGQGQSDLLAQPFTAAGVPNPFPSKSVSQNLNFAQEGYLPIGGNGTTFVVDPHLRTPYTYQYHLTFQQQIAGDLTLQAGYIGSDSHGLTSLVDINPYALGTFDRVLNLTPPAANCGVTQAFLCYQALYEFKNVSNANYNGLIASLDKQSSGHGFLGRSYFTLAYTYSHDIDNASGFKNRNGEAPYYSPDLFRASADMDVRNRLVFSGGWELPFDRAFSQAPSKLTRGWRIFPIVSYRSGFPLDVFARLESAITFSPGPSAVGDSELVRANLVGPLTLFNADSKRTFSLTGNYWFDPNSFSNAECPSTGSCAPGPTIFPSDAQAVADPAVRTYGTLPRNYFRGPSVFNVNLAIAKETMLTERLKLELRADLFNLPNTPQFQNPDTNINSPTFGQILSTYDPRIIQLAARFSF